MPKTPKEIERILFADGWYKDSQSGSHRHYKHPTKPGKVTIPFHSKDLPRKTEQRILQQAHLKPIKEV
ncbi:MAG: type II toxin-antitoxin system HicA family toxin [Agathobacter sp.]|nr:type II toxin-antitoxin system HicA family toxin [Agathobacter sp.]